jgi:hypothetical protein
MKLEGGAASAEGIVLFAPINHSQVALIAYEQEIITSYYWSVDTWRLALFMQGRYAIHLIEFVSSSSVFTLIYLSVSSYIIGSRALLLLPLVSRPPQAAGSR